MFFPRTLFFLGAAFLLEGFLLEGAFLLAVFFVCFFLFFFGDIDEAPSFGFAGLPQRASLTPQLWTVETLKNIRSLNCKILRPGQRFQWYRRF